MALCFKSGSEVAWAAVVVAVVVGVLGGAAGRGEPMGGDACGVKIAMAGQSPGASWLSTAATGGGRYIEGGQPDTARPRVPRRIVTIAPNSAEIICALGEGDRLVGVSTYCIYPAQLSDLPRIGGLFDPDIEKIISLHPDLMVVRGRCKPAERLCEQLGIDLHHDKTERLADIATCVRELGRILDRNDEASALIKRFQDRLDAIRKRTKGLPRPRVLITAQRQPDRIANLLTAGKGTFLDEMLQAAGGRNAFGHLDMPWPQVSPEAVIAARPEVIIELMPEVKLDDEGRRRLIEQWKQLGPMPAVTNRRIHFITDDHALIPSLRYIDIIEKVSRLLHPEVQGGA